MAQDIESFTPKKVGYIKRQLAKIPLL
jgi:hypothetical protein